jgi:hypothetical protein
MVAAILPMQFFHGSSIAPSNSITPADATYKGVGGHPKGAMAAHLLDVRKWIEGATKEAMETSEALQSREANFGKARVL